jgi:hypothetical protein
LESTQTFRVSLYGRFGYAAMTLLALPFAFFLFLPFSKSPPKELLDSILLVLVGSFGALCFIYFASQLFRKTPRFVITNNALEYVGLYVHKTIPWQEVLESSLDFPGRNGMVSSPMVFLQLRLKNKSGFRGKLRLDASGLTPNYEQLYSQVRKFVKQTPNNRFQPTSALTRRRG